MIPSDKSVTRDLTATSREAILLFSLRASVRVQPAEVVDERYIPFGKSLFLDIHPLLFQQYHGCMSDGGCGFVGINCGVDGALVGGKKIEWFGRKNLID